jgi:hypothetical protein
MSEIADSEVIEQTSDDFNMEEAQSELASDVFGATEVEADEVIEEASEEPADEVIDEVIDEVSEESKKAAPQSWKKEMHEHWDKLDPEVQDYFELREQQMKEGIEVAKDDATLGRDLRDVLTPYNELLQAQGVDQKTAVQFLLNAHHKLSTADEQGKLDAINQMAQSYGIKLDGSKVTPEIQTLQNEISQLKQVIGQSQQESQQEKRAKAEKEIEAFASDHEFFNEVADDIVPFLHSGLSLEESYDKAIWANPITRQKEIDRIEKEKADEIEKAKKEKVEKAKKAKSTNINSRDTNKTPTGPKGKMFDNLNDLYTDIQTR